MIKKIFVCIFTLCFLFSGSVSEVFASEITPKVIYDAKEDKFTVLDASGIVGENDFGDLFTNFKNVLPGDNLEQTIEVCIVNLKKGERIKLIMSSENQDEAYKELMRHITLSVNYEGKEVSSNLESGISLGTFTKDETKKVHATLQVPIDVGNEIKDQVAKVDWVFSAENIPSTSAPDTSDSSSALIYLALMILSVLAFTYCIRKLKRSRVEK